MTADLLEAGGVFVATNLDDLVLLALLFADRRIPARAVVLGQLLGIALLFGASACAALAAVAIPPGYVALLGAVPLGLGLAQGLRLLRRHRKGAEAPDDDDDEDDEVGASALARSPVLAVAGVTLANGADNLSAYIPMFAARRRLIPVCAVVFVLLVGVWCALGRTLVGSPVLGARLRRYGDHLLPVVLVLLGVEILAGARALF